MEFKEYLKVLKANIILIAIFAVLGFVTSFLGVSKISYPYKQSQLIFLQTTGDQNAQTQTFDGYYAGEKSRNFTDTAVALINSSDFQSEALSQSTSIDAKKLAPQLIRITISAPNSQNQAGSLNRAVQIFDTKVKGITGTSNISAIALSSPSQVAYSAPNKKVVAVAGAVAGFIFALCTIAAKTYFKL